MPRLWANERLEKILLYNEVSPKDWRRHLVIRRDDTGKLIVEPSERKQKYIASVGALMHRQGFRYTRNDNVLPGRPHFYLPKFQAAVFVCNCDYRFGIEHECHALREKGADHIGVEEENTRLLDLVVSAVEKLDSRVEVVFRCQLGNPDELANRLRLFIEGDSTYGKRDRLSWYRRKGDLAQFGLDDAAPSRFLIPIVNTDASNLDGNQFHIGRLGGDHFEIFEQISRARLNRIGNVKFGYTDHSGAFLNKTAALKYAIRHGMVHERLRQVTWQLDCDDLNSQTGWGTL